MFWVAFGAMIKDVGGLIFPSLRFGTRIFLLQVFLYDVIDKFKELVFQSIFLSQPTI